ncbi:MAG TPA: hypothetical protein VGC42_22285 [Kofleriaceae bacterium]
MSQPTPDDDVHQLAALARQLTAPDLDAERAARIAWTARQDVGRGPSPWRLVEPILAAAVTISYFLWALREIYAVWH